MRPRRTAPRRAVALVALALGGGVALRPARAQVNTEALRPQGERPGLSLGGEVSLGVAKGNVDYLDVGGGLRLQYQTLHRRRAPGPRFVHQRLFLATSARYAERTPTGGATEPFVSQSFVHARWTAMWLERLGDELFAQVQTNEFLRLRVRTLGGAGLRVAIVQSAALAVWGGTGTMLEYNRIEVAPGSTEPPTELSHRSTSYLGARVELAEGGLLLQLVGYVQPAWKKPADLRALVDLEALAKVTTMLGLSTSLSVLHDTRPPEAVRPTDLRLTTSLKVTF